MQKIQNLRDRIKNWSLRKKIIYGVVILLVVLGGYMIFRPKDNSANITTDIVKRGNLKETILATGQVTSTTDLNLSFYTSGIVRALRVKVGDKVKAGTVLATLDQGNEVAAFTSAQGAVAAAEARYKRTLDGASNEEITLAQIALTNAKLDYDRIVSQQEILVNNAYKNLLNSTPEALSITGTADFAAPTITGNYSKDKEGQINISVFQSSGGVTFGASGLANGTGPVTTTNPQPIGDSGLYIKFPSTTVSIVDWVISIPNKKAANYVTNYNAYLSAQKTRDAALGSAQALVDQKTAELSLKKSVARQADVDLAKADILSAQGQFQGAQANLEHKILRAPVDGTITKVDIKLGENAQAGKNVTALQDVDNLYLEANINEANVANIKIGALVELNFDAFGTDKLFSGKVLKIDPSSTLVSGVVNYKITASIDSTPALRPGMTANMTILVNQKDNILSTPTRSIVNNKIGNKIVRLVTNKKTKAYKEVDVTTGMEGDGGLTEIINGLNEGDEIVVLIKK